jgi:hypothetical protein
MLLLEGDRQGLLQIGFEPPGAACPPWAIVPTPTSPCSLTFKRCTSSTDGAPTESMRRMERMPSNVIWTQRNRYVLANHEAPEHNRYLQGLKLLCRPILGRSSTMTCRFYIDKPRAPEGHEIRVSERCGRSDPRMYKPLADCSAWMGLAIPKDTTGSPAGCSTPANGWL